MTKDELTGSEGLLRQLTSRFYERVLEAEMDEHLGYRKHDNAGDNTGTALHSSLRLEALPNLFLTKTLKLYAKT